MSDITNTSPVVTEDKLKDFYEDIKPFLGCPAYVTQEGDEMYFSSSEKVVGRWINGKPIYQKVITDTGLVLQWDGQRFARIDDVTPLVDDVDNVLFSCAIYDNTDWNHSKQWGILSINPKSTTAWDIYGFSGGYLIKHLIIQYTKTTDSASTTIETKPTHYSTDEQAVGIWLNNKPIWQKTVPVNATLEFLHNKIILEKKEFYKGINQDYVTYVYADADITTSHSFVQSNPTDMVFTYDSAGTTNVVLYQYVLTESGGIDTDIWYPVNTAKYTINSSSQLTVDKSAGFMNTSERIGMIQPIKLTYTKNGVEKNIYGGFYIEA